MSLQRDAEEINNCIFCWSSAWFMNASRSDNIHNALVTWLPHGSLQGSPAVSKASQNHEVSRSSPQTWNIALNLEHRDKRIWAKPPYI
ncbi:hypothetical protein KSB_44760 [Ktedonobacter robiniae]|uniref:Uncharacterized protein n=1 Tax=Ktedonobacter robiniae TaxID=2778365 RepID=A0ABQ3UT90_9CHLR|nr:hypothetical protein KSB_44760 [Ktedonobacter robiniae]